MPRNNPISLRTSLTSVDNLFSRVVVGAGECATWGDLAARSISGDPTLELSGRSVLLAMADNFAAAAALIQLDGITRRIVVCPPQVSSEHLAFVADRAEVDLIVTDRGKLESIKPGIECIVPSNHMAARELGAQDPHSRDAAIETEWILLTSGTTGIPKLSSHTLASLSGAIQPRTASTDSIVWATFYDVCRYGGLQVFLRAALTGTSLILSAAQDSTESFLARAAAHAVTHITGTPSHWRRALMTGCAGRIAPQYVRLSGEIADQSILNRLRAQYPQATVAHAFASTEAGVAFEVNDGFMGFPAEFISNTPNVEMKVVGGTLRVRSKRTATRYLGHDSPILLDSDGFVDTGDALELRSGRYYFAGRQDGIINVGGLKVHPEEVEAVINRHPDVSMSLVRMKKNPITGALVIADVVLTEARAANNGKHELQRNILEFCRKELPRHMVPAAINVVPGLDLSESGKMVRPHA
jgi:acyl-coenzyme A synthetase/AMP-(fatty) acid ligase